MRQFGCDPHIPQAPVNMRGYRKAKDAPFVCEDWLVKWFVDISRWDRFCDRLEGLVESTDIVSEAEYMAWYANITRDRIARSQPKIGPKYASRGLYPNMEGYRVVSSYC